MTAHEAQKFLESLPDAGPSEWSIEQLREWTECGYVCHGEYHRTALRKLLAHIDGNAGPWRSMDSAPRDGSLFLAWSMLRGPCLVQWMRCGTQLVDHESRILRGFCEIPYGGASQGLTHWMPLPAGPEGVGGPCPAAIVEVGEIARRGER